MIRWSVMSLLVSFCGWGADPGKGLTPEAWAANIIIATVLVWSIFYAYRIGPLFIGGRAVIAAGLVYRALINYSDTFDFSPSFFSLTRFSLTTFTVFYLKYSPKFSINFFFLSSLMIPPRELPLFFDYPRGSLSYLKFIISIENEWPLGSKLLLYYC